MNVFFSEKDEARENTRESKVVFPVSQTNARTAVQDTKPGEQQHG